MGDKFVNETGLGAIRSWILTKIAEKILAIANPSENVTFNSSGQLDVGGRLGQMSNTTGIYSPKTINPASVGNGSFLLTEGSGQKLGNKSLAVVTGTGLTVKSASAGTTTYLVSNTYENRIICAGLVGGVLALNESTAAQNYVNITSVTIGGYAPSNAYYWTASGDITIKTDASINPDSTVTSVRPYASGNSSGFSNLFVGQLAGGNGGASIVVGQKVNSASGNANAIVGASMYNTGNGNAMFGRQHINKKNRAFLAGTGHDTTNGPSEGVAALGKWSDIKPNTSFAIGNGTSDTNRSNSFEIDTAGDAFFGGSIDVSGVITGNNGTRNISLDISEKAISAYVALGMSSLGNQTLDKILYFVATRLEKLSEVTKTQSFTFNDKTFMFCKVGAIVFIDASGDINGIPQGVTNIGTLDADMRPNYTQRYRAANDLAAENRFLGVEPDGKVYLYSSVAKTGATNNSFSGFAFIASSGVS